MALCEMAPAGTRTGTVLEWMVGRLPVCGAQRASGWVGWVQTAEPAGAAALLAMTASRLAAGELLAVVDAGNRFDPYQLIRLVHATRADPNEFLRRIFISRCFNAHQTEALVRRDLPAIVAARAIRSVLVHGLTETFRDEAIGEAEARRLLESALRALRDLAERGVCVLVEEVGSRAGSRRAEALWALLGGAVDVRGQLRLQGPRGEWVLTVGGDGGTHPADVHAAG